LSVISSRTAMPWVAKKVSARAVNSATVSAFSSGWISE
jgi:hypothetical protein